MSLGLSTPVLTCSNSRGHCRLTGTGCVRIVSPLFIASPNLTALNSGPKAPTTETLPPLRTESMHQLSATGDPPCSLSLAPVTCWKNAPSASAPTASMHTSAPRNSVVSFGPLHDVVDLREVDRLGMGEPARVLEAVVDVVDDDDAAGAHQPGRLGGEQPDRPGAEDHHHVAFADLAELRAEVAGRARVGEQHRVLFVHPLGNLARADVGERHAHELGLAAVVAAAGVRVAVDAADRAGVRVDVVAVAVEAARAEEARAAADVERHHHAVADAAGCSTDEPTSCTVPTNSWPNVWPTRRSGIMP